MSCELAYGRVVKVHLVKRSSQARENAGSIPDEGRILFFQLPRSVGINFTVIKSDVYSHVICNFCDRYK